MFQWPEQNALLESANWEIPGFGRGVKHVLVHNGKVMFAQAHKIEESLEEASSTKKSKNEEAMDQYVEAWQIGDMRHCLSVLVGLENLRENSMSSFSSRTRSTLLAGFPRLQFQRMRSTNISSSLGCRWCFK